MENFEEKRKKVDESWKETVDKEKSETGQKSEAKQDAMPEMNFSLFLSSLMIEGLMALGEIENPVTNKKEMNLAQAKYVIDIISMLQEKTNNNLTPEEKNGVEQVLYELRMRYVSKSK